MIDKTQLASDLFQDVGWAVVKPLYGIFLDGKLLNIKGIGGSFFHTKGGALTNLTNYGITRQKYMDNMAPAVMSSWADPLYYLECQNRKDKQKTIAADYKFAIKELIKDGRLEIKII